MKLNLRISILSLLMLSTLLFPACLKKQSEKPEVVKQDPVVLNFYGLFDSEDIYLEMIQEFQKANPLISIRYKKFTDPEAYLDLIINELAEGKGPDIFLMQNTWFPRHYKKLMPAPDTLVNPERFKELFVEIAAEDLIIPDDEGVEKIWGLPLYVDTLALYYNEDYFEEVKPSTGRPADTWEGIRSDVQLLNRQDNSFSRFRRSGIAMGRGDNISRAFDIIMLLMLQSKADFYSSDLTSVMFDTAKEVVDAFDLYSSFALPSQRNYSWNAYLADSESAEKEIRTFASGKTSMILGYSYAYEDIVREIALLERSGEDAIDINDIGIQEVPQIFDPNLTNYTKETYGTYFVPVVSRTSQYSEEAWSFLASMVSEENLRSYYKATKRPSALRSLIPEQENMPIYGVFASQVGYAASIPMADPAAYKKLFLAAIDALISTASTEDVVKDLADEIQKLIPLGGVKPTKVVAES